MATSNEQRRVTKRSPNACSRCRRQKIKCSGLQPCANCSKRSLTCIFDDRDNKVLVSQGYLSDLQEKVARLERSQRTEQMTATESQGINENSRIDIVRNEAQNEQHEQTTRSSVEGTLESSPSRGQENQDASDLTNPLTATPSKFLSSSSGRTFYLGTSSNWSFHGRVLSLVHEHIRHSPLPATDLLFDGSAYDLWDGSSGTSVTNAPIIPGIDYAIYLINAVKFHCAQLVHLFDEEEFMANLHAFYSNDGSPGERDSLWYVQFLFVIAFGKTFVRHEHNATRPPGADFFVKALQLLPDTNHLCREPILAPEVLCCKALYLQALDSRNAAYATIGQAMRIALAQGMHTDMPVVDLGERFVQRCRRIWWTVYILDRQMTSLMGLPQSIRDENISCQLPVLPGSPQRTAALSMQIKLSRVLDEINNTIYGTKGRLRKKFVISIKAVLEGIASLAVELRQSFPLQADDRFGGISRMPAHLHLLYYQSIIIATRPLLFCCLKKRFEKPTEAAWLVSSNKIRHLLNISLESSQNILGILGSLQDQGLLETFLPWDLDSLFVSTMVLILSSFLDPSLLENHPSWTQKAYTFLDAMISGGNRIAEFRKRELQRLDEMLSDYIATQAQLSSTPNVPQASSSIRPPAFPPSFQDDVQMMRNQLPSQDNLSLYAGFSDESSGYGDDLTAEQILAVAESMDFEGTDWMSFATMETLPGLDEHRI